VKGGKARSAQRLWRVSPPEATIIGPLSLKRRVNVETITITLDGVPISGRPGTTILELAREVGLRIPTLCHDPCLKPVGACRVCLVEDEASNRLLAACVAPIAPGMRIQIRSQRVLETRRVIVKLLLANHPESCVVCDKGNRCQLRQLAADLGIGILDYDRMPSPAEIQDLNPFIVRDLSKCILCAKCIRADHELVVVGALDYLHRGFDARPTTFLETSLEGSECTFCGTCVSMCPTGALMEKDPPHRGTVGRRVGTTCGYCGCGCSLWAHAVDGRLVHVAPRAEDTASQATLCVRGHYGGDYLHHPDRLLSPLVRRDGELRPATWEEALSEVVRRIDDLVNLHGPQTVAFFGSTQCTNEENYLLQKIARVGVGTPHLDNGARFHAISSILGLKEVLGVVAATNPMEDLESAQVILVVGAQPSESHPVASYRIKRAVRQKGARLICAGAVQDSLSPMSNPWVRLRPGGELAFILGLTRSLALDPTRRQEPSGGEGGRWGTFRAELEKQDPAALDVLAGVDAAIRRDVAEALSSTHRCAIVFGPGISQSPGGLDKVMALANMAMLIGCLGVTGGGIFPLDRSANTQGACDMGTLPQWLPGYGTLGDREARERFESRWGQRLPEGPGWSLPEMVEAARRGELRGLYVLGENPLAVLPREARKALEGLELLVVQDIFRTQTAERAHVVLPGAGFVEKDGTYTSLERRVQRVRAVVNPPGEARPDWWILAEILRRMAHGPEYDTPADVMKEIGVLVPEYAGIQYGRLEIGGIFWPCPDPRSTGETILLRGGTDGFRPAVFAPDPGDSALRSDPEHPWRAFRGESLFHFAGGTRSGRSGRLGRFRGEGHVHLNPQDLLALGVGEGDSVRLISRHGRIELRASSREELPPGTAWIIPAAGGVAMGELVPWEWDPVTHMPNLHTVAVRIEKAGE
jgi:formate dehydrogenase (NADP+) alpha subunit